MGKPKRKPQGKEKGGFCREYTDAYLSGSPKRVASASGCLVSLALLPLALAGRALGLGKR